MPTKQRIAAMTAVALLGLAAAIWHTGTNYQWRDGRWAPNLPLLIPFAAALPPIAIYLCIKELLRTDGRKVLAALLLLPSLFALLIDIVPLLLFQS